MCGGVVIGFFLIEADCRNPTVHYEDCSHWNVTAFLSDRGERERFAHELVVDRLRNFSPRARVGSNHQPSASEADTLSN